MPINYQALLGLIEQNDPRGLVAAKKLTPDEQQEFFDFQQTRNADMGRGDFNRPDNSIAGLPPELAVVGGAKVLGTGAELGLGEMGTIVKDIAKTAAPIYAIEQLPLPASVKTALMFALGIKGASKGTAGIAGAGIGAAAGEGAALSKLPTRVMPQSAAEYEAVSGMPRGSGGPPSTPPPPRLPGNLFRKSAPEAVGAGEGPSSGARGVQVSQSAPAPVQLRHSNPDAFDNGSVPAHLAQLDRQHAEALARFRKPAQPPSKIGSIQGRIQEHDSADKALEDIQRLSGGSGERAVRATSMGTYKEPGGARLREPSNAEFAGKSPQQRKEMLAGETSKAWNDPAELARIQALIGSALDAKKR